MKIERVTTSSERASELQLLSFGLGGPTRHAAARRNSNESGFVKIISRGGLRWEAQNASTAFCHIENDLDY